MNIFGDYPIFDGGYNYLLQHVINHKGYEIGVVSIGYYQNTISTSGKTDEYIQIQLDNKMQGHTLFFSLLDYIKTEEIIWSNN